MDKRHYVYLLRCADGSLYTGMTPDIARRLRQHVEHLAGCAKYTRSHPVTALALLLTTDTATTARQLERAHQAPDARAKRTRSSQTRQRSKTSAPHSGADIRPVLVQRSQTTSPTRKTRQTPERLPGLDCQKVFLFDKKSGLHRIARAVRLRWAARAFAGRSIFFAACRRK